MTVIIRQDNRKCDARCYRGKTPAERCKCICGGHNHGVGFQEAIRNNYRMVGIPAPAEISLQDSVPEKKGGAHGAP